MCESYDVEMSVARNQGYAYKQTKVLFLRDLDKA